MTAGGMGIARYVGTAVTTRNSTGGTGSERRILNKRICFWKNGREKNRWSVQLGGISMSLVVTYLDGGLERTCLLEDVIDDQNQLYLQFFSFCSQGGWPEPSTTWRNIPSAKEAETSRSSSSSKQSILPNF